MGRLQKFWVGFASISLACALNIQNVSGAAFTLQTNLTSGNWGDSSSWQNGSSTPGAASGDSVQIVDLAAGSHTLTLAAATTYSLTSLTISQSLAAPTSNLLLDIRKNITFTDTAILEPTIASGNNSTVNIYLNPTTNGVTLTLGNKLKLNSNVTLTMGSLIDSSSSLYTSTLGASLEISGGTLNIEKGKTKVTNAAEHRMTSLTMTSGTINLGYAPVGYTQSDSAPTGYNWNSDVRLVSNNDLSITGGNLNIYVAGQIYMLGAANTITGVTVNYDPTNSGTQAVPVYSMASSGNQSLTTDIILANLTLRGSGVKTISNSNTTSTGTVGTIAMATSSTSTPITLLLGNDLIGKSGSSFQVQGNSALPAAGSTATFIIDTASYTLDWSKANAVSFSNGTNSGTVYINWTLQGAGIFKGSSFNLTGPYATNVKNTLKLVATGGNSTVNNLGNSGAGATANGTIDATTYFIYAGTAAYATPATLISNRTIGILEVDSGNLNINQAALNTGGGVNLVGGGLLLNGSSAGAVTMASGQNYTQTGGTLYLTLGTTYDQIASSGGGTFNITGGTIALDLQSGFSYANTYTVLNGFTSGTVSGLTITGYDTVNYLATLGTNGAISFSAIPETSTTVMLVLGLLSAVAVARRMKRFAV